MSANLTKQAESQVFYQIYNSYKEITDVAKTKLFQSRFLEQLAQDSKARALIKQAEGGRTVSAAKVKESYSSGKARLANALAKGQKKLYGVREEHRLMLSLFQQIKNGLITANN